MAGGEWAVVAGAAIGILGTLGSTWLAHQLDGRKQSRIDKARKDLLKKTLAGAEKTGWMSVETLAHIIGADLDTTRALLIEINARGSMKTEKEMWSLISRNPLPTDSDAG
ncbi:hypothetical protein [Hyphomonas pacifica]|uniref:Uncharacterized protein n=1 Tax=Hyphomonas pacifica TaxID=1280941 RepID=A0A062TRB8_9PROT|nr:hypothetical protein [Hyphomonas pacifica]KCZ50371.1 hypothetical protein HY2_14185 [Hyphomonas pacifica]RAN32663.1 hypothetical protein HY3_14665 [Hyphomonas pacifica]